MSADAQEEAYRRFYAAQIDAGRCPHSGLLIVSCKGSDLCDCFDVLDPRVGQQLRTPPRD